jgi:putative transcriptional regulator
MTRFVMQLKALREKRGFTQEAMAKRVGISRAYLARLEMGRHDPKLSLLTRLAKVLKVKIGQLVD